MDYRLLWSCFLYFSLAFKSGHSQNTSVQNTSQSFSTVGQTSLTPGSSYTIHAIVANTSNVSLITMHSSSTTVSTSKNVSNITLFLNASNINNHFSTPSNSVSSNYSISETTPAYFIPPSKQPLSTYNTQYATNLKLATSYLTATRTTNTPRKTATSTTDTVSLTTLTRSSTVTPSIPRSSPPLDTIYTTTSTPTTPTSAALTDTMYNSTITTLTSTSTITTSTPHATSKLYTFTTSSQTSFTTLLVSSKYTSTYSFTTKINSTQPDSPSIPTLQSSAGESVTNGHSPSSTTARLTIGTLIITPPPSSTAKIATSIDSTSKIVPPFTTESVVTILSTVMHTMSTISPTKAAGTANKSTISVSYFATKTTPGSSSITKHKSTIHTITSVTIPTEMSSMTGATVSIATEPATTGGTTNIPKVFFVIASINLEWNAQYGIRYTEESKKLKDQLETALQKELKALDRFISILIIRFFKGSVKFESEVYFNQSSTVNEESLSTKIESTDIGKLGKIEVIKIERNKDNTSTVQNSKPLLQPWMIVAIAAGAVVLIYTIILIILMVKFRRLKRQSTSLTRSRSSTFFNMALVNNNSYGIAVEDNEIETFSFRKTSTIERPELQTFASIEEASDDKKDGGNDITSNHDNHIPVMTFNVGSDSSGSINESKEKDDVSEQTDNEADDEMDEDEVEVKKEKEPEPGEKDGLVEKESNVSPFY